MDTEKQDQHIIIQISSNFDGPDIPETALKKLIRTICNRFRLRKADISVAIVDDAQIRQVSKKFLKRDHTTDCLSFDLTNNDDSSTKSFELMVNAEMATRQAALRGHSSEAELALYVTHGLLHNLGFDDSTPQQAEKMHETEDEILQQLGYGQVYNGGKEKQ